jgi:hypothetical protein
MNIIVVIFIFQSDSYRLSLLQISMWISLVNLIIQVGVFWSFFIFSAILRLLEFIDISTVSAPHFGEGEKSLGETTRNRVTYSLTTPILTGSGCLHVSH